GELVTAGDDVGPAGGPAGVQARLDADDLADRPLTRVSTGAGRELDPERVVQVVFEGGVVGLGRCHVRLEDHPPVDRQPLARFAGLDLVRHRDVGVQVGVPGTGIAVGERGRDQTSGFDLAYPFGALPR